jgi:hypothetical protein
MTQRSRWLILPLLSLSLSFAGCSDAPMSAPVSVVLQADVHNLRAAVKAGHWEEARSLLRTIDGQVESALKTGAMEPVRAAQIHKATASVRKYLKPKKHDKRKKQHKGNKGKDKVGVGSPSPTPPDEGDEEEGD